MREIRYIAVGCCWHPKDLEGVDEKTSNETSVPRSKSHCDCVLKTLEPGRCLRHLGIIPRLIVMARLHPSLTSSMRGGTVVIPAG